MDIVWIVLLFGGCAGLWYWASRLEPHFVSKDGERFMATMQTLTTHDLPDSRIREVRGRFLDDGLVRLDQKQPIGRSTATWRVVGRSPLTAKGKVIFTLREVESNVPLTRRQAARRPTNPNGRVALRLPHNSTLIERLDALAATPERHPSTE
jgi:hypothetical protein